MNKFLRIFTNNWHIKFLMLLSAIALWIFVSVNQSKSGKFPGAIKIDTRNLNTGTVAVLSEEYAELTIQAAPTKWQTLQPDQFDVYVDLKDLETGTHEVNVSAVSKINGVSIEKINPKKIIINIEPVITRELPITVVIKGEPAEGYIVGNYSAKPTTATISAARSIVSSIDQITAEVDVTDKTESFTSEETLQVADKLAKNVSMNPGTIDISVSIVKSGRSRTVGIKPNIIGSPEDGFYISAISIVPSTVTVTGDLNNINLISSINTEEININNINSDKTFDTKLVIPSSVTTDTTTAQVKISVSKIAT